jgi:hypothetical protein
MSTARYGDYQFDIHFDGPEGQLLRAILAELDLLMAIDGFPPPQTCAPRAHNAFSRSRLRRPPSFERKSSCRSFM